jgi:hypothetical protein
MFMASDKGASLFEHSNNIASMKKNVEVSYMPGWLFL